MKVKPKKRLKFKKTTISYLTTSGKPAYRNHKKEHLNGRANSQKVKGVGGAKAKDRHHESGRGGTSQTS